MKEWFHSPSQEKGTAEEGFLYTCECVWRVGIFYGCGMGWPHSASIDEWVVPALAGGIDGSAVTHVSGASARSRGGI